jgi:hypothetical protein
VTIRSGEAEAGGVSDQLPREPPGLWRSLRTTSKIGIIVVILMALATEFTSNSTAEWLSEATLAVLALLYSRSQPMFLVSENTEMHATLAGMRTRDPSLLEECWTVLNRLFAEDDKGSRSWSWKNFSRLVAIIALVAATGWLDWFTWSRLNWNSLNPVGVASATIIIFFFILRVLNARSIESAVDALPRQLELNLRTASELTDFELANEVLKQLELVKVVRAGDREALLNARDRLAAETIRHVTAFSAAEGTRATWISGLVFFAMGVAAARLKII